ncbi:MAG: hydrolase [Salinarimonadaceae bacterium]|nr:MAG: hydrolase [Salinarimonadaceae bacterium]
MLMQAQRSRLLIVDFQERLTPVISAADAAIARTRTLIAAASALGAPIDVTEQYPKGLGPTIAPIRDALPEGARFHEKITFSALRDPAFAAHLSSGRAEGRDQIVICGAEAHVCVLQSALDLAAAGYGVFLVADAIGSRAPLSVDLAIARARQAGCVVVNTEMVVFEWMERGGTEVFRAVSKLIK